MKAKMKKALRTRKAAMKNGFLSKRMKELKKNRTKDSSCTRISILKPARRGKIRIGGKENLVLKGKRKLLVSLRELKWPGTGGGGLSPQGQVAGWGHSWLAWLPVTWPRRRKPPLRAFYCCCCCCCCCDCCNLSQAPRPSVLNCKGISPFVYADWQASKSEKLTCATSVWQAYTRPCLAGLWPNIHPFLRVKVQYRASKKLRSRMSFIFSSLAITTHRWLIFGSQGRNNFQVPIKTWFWHVVKSSEYFIDCALSTKYRWGTLYIVLWESLTQHFSLFGLFACWPLA